VKKPNILPFIPTFRSSKKFVFPNQCWSAFPPWVTFNNCKNGKVFCSSQTPPYIVPTQDIIIDTRGTFLYFLHQKLSFYQIMQELDFSLAFAMDHKKSLEQHVTEQKLCVLWKGG
jgi:hypothetical protein